MRNPATVGIDGCSADEMPHQRVASAMPNPCTLQMSRQRSEDAFTKQFSSET
jgi:hypothetical protein